LQLGNTSWEIRVSEPNGTQHNTNPTTNFIPNPIDPNPIPIMSEYHLLE